MMIEASQRVMEDKIIEIHLNMVKEAHGNNLNLVGIMVKKTKDNFCEVEEMMKGQNQETGEMVNFLNALDTDLKIALI